MELFKKKRRKSNSADANAPKTLHKNLEFTATEQYKLLRANLNFTLPENIQCPIIGITSSMRGEGKSTTSVNLSYVLAESGKKVLLIDGDLRIPSVAKKMDIDGSVGLTTLLMDANSHHLDEFKSTLLDNWYILPAGELPPNPSELLGSRRMEVLLKAFAERFDYIVIDLPPVNIVSDALAVSHMIAGMIVVIREDYAQKKEVENCFRQLKLSNVNVLGCVMNYSKNGKGAYGRYKKYYKHYKYYNYYKHSEDAED